MTKALILDECLIDDYIKNSGFLANQFVLCFSDSKPHIATCNSYNMDISGSLDIIYT